MHIVHNKNKRIIKINKLTLVGGGIGSTTLAWVLLIGHGLLLCPLPLHMEHFILVPNFLICLDFSDLYVHQLAFFLPSLVYSGPLLILGGSNLSCWVGIHCS